MRCSFKNLMLALLNGRKTNKTVFLSLFGLLNFFIKILYTVVLTSTLTLLFGFACSLIN